MVQYPDPAAFAGYALCLIVLTTTLQRLESEELQLEQFC